MQAYYVKKHGGEDYSCAGTSSTDTAEPFTALVAYWHGGNDHTWLPLTNSWPKSHSAVSPPRAVHGAPCDWKAVTQWCASTSTVRNTRSQSM